MSLSAKRKRECSTDSEKEMKHPCVDFQPTSSSSIINSPLKFVRCAFVKSCNESVITIKEKQSPKTFPAAPNSNNKPILPPSLPRQLFKPCKDSNTASDKPNSFQLSRSPTTGEPKDAMVAHANKNPKAPPSQPHLHKVSPKSSTTFDSIESPDCCLPSPKIHNKNTNAEREACTQTSPSSNHKESVKIVSSPHHPDLRSPSFAEQAGSCKMETDERTQLKVEQSRSPKAIMPATAVSVKVEGSREHKCCLQWKDPLDIELGDDSGDELREHCNISLSSSSSGHEDEPLPSLEKLMSRRDHVPVTPEKDAFSEPNTPVSKAAVSLRMFRKHVMTSCVINHSLTCLTLTNTYVSFYIFFICISPRQWKPKPLVIEIHWSRCCKRRNNIRGWSENLICFFFPPTWFSACLILCLAAIGLL